MTQPDLLVPEVKRPGPFFHDQGRYTLLTNQNVESGKFEVDTCPADQMGNFKDWESLIHLAPDNAILPEDDSDTFVPEAYTSRGEALRLWEDKLDPAGTYAKLVHDKIVELVKRSLPYDELKEQIEEYVADVKLAMEGAHPKLTSGE